MKHIHSPCNQEAFIPIPNISVADPDLNYSAGPGSEYKCCGPGSEYKSCGPGSEIFCRTWIRPLVLPKNCFQKKKVNVGLLKECMHFETSIRFYDYFKLDCSRNLNF